MRVYTRPPQHHSQAMYRVSNALERYAPEGITFVPHAGLADFRIVHAIGPDVVAQITTRKYAVVQYCLKSAKNTTIADWLEIWRGALAVWSYYDLPYAERFNFHYAPLGADAEVFQFSATPRHATLLTSGYVSGDGAEAIEDCALAAERVDGRTLHLGPKPHGWKGAVPAGWSSFQNVSDEALAHLYACCRYVSGLRYVEGFELPVVEGALCGTRPIIFDRPEVLHWFGDFARVVPEVSGPPLVEELCSIFKSENWTVTKEERDSIAERFSWKTVVEAFWQKVMEAA